MTRVRDVSVRAARLAASMAILLTTIAPLPAFAQQQDAPNPPAPASAPAAAAPAQAQAAAQGGGLSESAAAVVNDEIISTYDLAQRMRLLIAASGVQPTEQNLPQFQAQALQALIEERLQLQELRRLEKEQKTTIIATTEEVDDVIAQNAKEGNLSPQQYLGQLAALGISPDTMRQQIRAQMSWQRWIRGRYGSRLRIGDDQIKATQERMEAAANKPQYQVSEVLIDATRVGGMQAAMDGAKQLAAQLEKGAPFAAVARQFSAASTAANGGDAGWVSPGEMPAEVDAVLEQMRPGQLSQPIPVRDGVYLIYLRDKRAGAGTPMVSMKQAAVALSQGAPDSQVAEARAKLEAVRAQATGCNDLEAAAAKTPGVVAGDLGEAQVSDLAPAFREAAQTLKVGELSQPLRTAAGLHIVAVCARRIGGIEELSKEQIENRLFGQQLTMISRRYMRDLMNSATIETR